MASSRRKGKNKRALLNNLHHLRVYQQRMRDDETLHDVVFIVENERFPVNRCLVAAASPVLRNMMTNGMKESKQREIPLEEVNVDVWKVVVDYVYTGQMDLVNVENALKLLECAARFHMKELEDSISSYVGQELNDVENLGNLENALRYLKCAQRFRMEKSVKTISGYIKNVLDASNCCDILSTVDHIELDSLRKLAMNTLVINFYNVYHKIEFNKLSYETVLEILRCRELQIRSEFDVFLAAVYWALCSGMSEIECETNAEIAKQGCEM